jgi:hypothetical protein
LPCPTASEGDADVFSLGAVDLAQRSTGSDRRSVARMKPLLWIDYC